jgi:predicted oxidoreductase
MMRQTTDTPDYTTMLNYPTPAIGLWRLMEWNLDRQAVLQWTHQILDLGAHVFDLADVYGDYQVEAHFGSALALEPALRERLFLISKCDIKLMSTRRPAHRLKYYDTSYAHIMESVEASLRQLHTDRLDLLLIHRPDPLMNADEVAEAFNALKQAGKVRNFGVSNFSTGQFDLLASRLNFPLLTNQVELSVLQSAALYDGTLDQCQRLKISPMAWSPLGGGQLFAGHGEQQRRVRVALEKVGLEKDGWTLDQVALAWILTHPARIVPVLGTRNMDNIRAAVAIANTKLTREQWFSILEAIHGHEVP